MEDIHTTVSVTNGVGVHPRGGATAEWIGDAAENARDAEGVTEEMETADRSARLRIDLPSICIGCVLCILILVLEKQKAVEFVVELDGIADAKTCTIHSVMHFASRRDISCDDNDY